MNRFIPNLLFTLISNASTSTLVMPYDYDYVTHDLLFLSFLALQLGTSTTSLSQGIEYIVHLPKLTQVVTGKNFHYFKLRLYDIKRYFPHSKSWNTNYPPGQKIYCENPAAMTLRSAIQAEHAILYSGRTYRDGNESGTLERTSTSFFELLAKYPDTKSLFSPAHSAAKAGLSTITSLFGSSTATSPEEMTPSTRARKLPIYTYVLLDDSLRFSRSGAGMSVDMSSKHALHAGAATEVLYAGEFWVEHFTPHRHGQGPVLYVDNNSGTFAPPKADLYRMKQLMEANFPGIPMVVLDYQDLEWKRLRGKE